MNNNNHTLFLHFALFVTEVLVSIFILSLVESSFLIGAEGALLWNLWRLIFFGLPFLLMYALIFKYLAIIRINKVLIMGIFNLCIYILFSIVYNFIWEGNALLPPHGLMFRITSISVLISPFIIDFIPFFKRIISEQL
jgi:hypothetical protein